MPHQPAGTTGEADIAHVRRLVDRGEYLKAYDQAMRTEPSSEAADMKKLKSRLLSALGMNLEAISLVESIQTGQTEEEDWELLAHLGSLYKKQWLATRKLQRSSADSCIRLSLSSYEKARSLGGDYWCAINAATLAKILGEGEKALDYAEQVMEECWCEYRKTLTTSTFWIPATLGEACLVKEDYSTAVKWYNAARSHVAGNLGWLQSARRNAKLLIEAIAPGKELADRILDSLPRMRIALFAGHRLDEKGSKSTRFPEEMSDRVKVKIRKELSRLRLDVGIASAAEGSDILFHESMQEMGKRTVIVLPYPLDCFREQLVEAAGEDWGRRFDVVTENADHVEISSLGRFCYSQDFIHCFCSDYLLASAVDMALVNDAELIPIVLWDGKISDRRGGTSDTVSKLVSMGLRPHWIKLTGLCASGSGLRVLPAFSGEESMSLSGNHSCPRVKPILVINYHRSTESEEERIQVISLLLRMVESAFDAKDNPILRSAVFRNGLYMVFENMEAAWELVARLLTGNEGEQDYSLLLHAGVIVNLPTALSGTRDFYCREIEEALLVCETLRKPSRICTMQARALSGTINLDNDAFQYQGRFQFEEGSLKLFRFTVR